MTPFQHIRIKVFAMSPGEFATLLGVHYTAVGRWERGERLPGYDTLKKIRDAAKAMRLTWRDSWFFDEPDPR
jgi:DNA-binding transcriptional regulator YiaG